MLTKNKGTVLAALLIAVMLVLSACGGTPEVVEVEKQVTVVVEGETVVETVIETVEVEKEVTIVETVEVEKEVEVAGGARGTCGTVNILYWQAVSMLNPYLSGGTKDIEAGSLIVEPLARYNESGVMVPWLVDEIPTVENGGVSEDLTSITWKLKEGIVWSDGTPLTAEDVVFTGEYCLDPEMGCNALSSFADVESAEAIDDLTFKINFSTPKPFPYGPLVGQTPPILQKAQFEDCMGAKAQ
jgi:peptide/nickel transport system substrate-binding protein